MAKVDVIHDYEKTLRKDSLETVDGDSVDVNETNEKRKYSKSTIILSLVIGLFAIWIIIVSAIAIHRRIHHKNELTSSSVFDIIVEHAQYDVQDLQDVVYDEPIYEDMRGISPMEDNSGHIYDEVVPMENGHVTVPDPQTHDKQDDSSEEDSPCYATDSFDNSLYDVPKHPVPVKQEAGIRGGNGAIVKSPRVQKKPVLSPDNDSTVEVSGPRTYIQNPEFEDSFYLPIDQRCYKMSYSRSIPETGYSCRFIAKAARIPNASERPEVYRTMYYWIFQKGSEYYIHHAGPYDGDHLINIHEKDFSDDGRGSFTLAGMSDVRDMEKKAAEGKITRRYLNINKRTANFRNINDLYSMFRMKERIYKETYGDEAHNGNKTTSRYSRRVIELSNCLYSL
ncbi:hypothetical protein BEWA_024670 [Theileria equi strain WA]|uniref:Uncharacterized protein n=1 Tax=Theileria equi strain WA TaxID=1537102 RepID=L0AWI4_THEEQ|nr:hypothetical protein BEWA_024670 [Theileria equi strain WA]AFZ79618.1 hypothetical protein BEWA_024670 [Theileria equi strain WA]|eukprot:XP_004829284.1 hypothetical protein BEWA_024670 [Theileria equi strain WA]